MNRRSFFKMITGFAAGVYVAFAPGKNSFTSVVQAEDDPLHESRRSGIRPTNEVYCYVPYTGVGSTLPPNVPYDTAIFPAFAVEGSYIGCYWKVSEEGLRGKNEQTEHSRV